MIRIKLPQKLPPEIETWKLKSLEITQEILSAPDLEKKHALIERYKNHWRNEELVSFLSEISFEKCWYTETKFGGDYQEVEHFRPKKETKNSDGTVHITHSGYYWLAFELSNYRLCKSRPNRKKGTFFPIINERYRAADESEPWQDETPLFLDPLRSSDVLLLSFNDNGKAAPEIKLGVDDIRRVKFTIEKFHLNERILNSRRKQTWNTARDLFNSYLNALNDATKSIAKRQDAENELNKLESLLARDAEFSSVAKASLMKTGDPIAIKIACTI
ncbi:hypothetical protein [Pseudomonas brassicacearum]|uniref:hypothetical protein n=1 Tax=Pseudomonas brassicacearum TaxID=930166 RepID=UPI001E0BB28D|nr:hypothetical protein [Pseudomonas brassicacearum]CAH0283597.1 hypothetical protein SRABI06_04019 [Pseudomonas brassicacearum]